MSILLQADKNQNCCDTPFKTTCGGQALIEGIMMQGPEKRCTVVRNPEGEPVIKTEPIPPKKKIWTVPFLRGIVGFGGSMAYGVKALMYSAEVAGDETFLDEEPSKLDQWIEKHFSGEMATKIILGLAVVLGIGFPSVCSFSCPPLLPA